MPEHKIHFSSIFVKAAGGFAAEPAGGDVFFQQRASAILGIAEAVVQHFEDVHANIEADEVGEFERAHRMVHAKLHHRVHGLRRGHAFHHRVGGFVNHGHKHAIRDEAGRVIHGDRFFPELFAESHGGAECVVAGLQAANHFDKHHHRNGIHEM